MSRLIVIEDIFAIEGRGVAVCGRYENQDNARFFIGDKVELRRRDGSIRDVTIRGIGMGSLLTGFADMLLDSSITKEEIGVGDEIWLMPK